MLISHLSQNTSTSRASAQGSEAIEERKTFACPLELLRFGLVSVVYCHASVVFLFVLACSPRFPLFSQRKEGERNCMQPERLAVNCLSAPDRRKTNTSPVKVAFLRFSFA